MTAALAAVGLVIASQASAAQELARYDARTELSANGGTVVWSAYDPADRRFRLMIHQQGASRQAPVPPRAVPFDVDVGRRPGGGPLIVYSRCVDESYDPASGIARASGCDLRAFDPARGRERAIGVDGSEPAVWRDRVAFTRRGRLYVTSVRGGSVRRVRIRGGGRVLDVDLRRERLAVTVGEGGAGSDVIAVRLQRLDGTRPRLVLSRAAGESQRELVGVGFDRGSLGFALVCREEDCAGRAYHNARGRLRTALVPDTLEDFALTRGRAFWVDSPDEAVRSIVVRHGPLSFR